LSRWRYRCDQVLLFLFGRSMMLKWVKVEYGPQVWFPLASLVSCVFLLVLVTVFLLDGFLLPFLLLPPFLSLCLRLSPRWIYPPH